MPPLPITSSSRSFPHEPPICTKTDLSSKRSLSLSTFLSAIHCHLSLDSFRTSWSTPEVCANVCADINTNSNPRNFDFLFIRVVFVELVFDGVGVSDTTEGQCQELPVIGFLCIDLRYGKLVHRIVATHYCCQRDAIPDNCHIIDNLDSGI